MLDTSIVFRISQQWCKNGQCIHSWFITGFVTRLTRRVPLVEQELMATMMSP